MQYEPAYPLRFNSEQLEHYRARLGTVLFEQRYQVQMRHWRLLHHFERRKTLRQHFLYRDVYIRWIFEKLGLLKAGRRNMLAITVRENRVTLAGLRQPFRLMHITDPHFGADAELAEAIQQAISGLDYDAVALTGDYRDSKDTDFATSSAYMQTLLQSLNAPAYLVFGNHDIIEQAVAIEALEGKRVLFNEAATLTVGQQEVWLCGVDDPGRFRTHDCAAALKPVPNGAPSILLAHTPNIIREASHYRFGYMLCGHTHGGQVCLPGGQIILRNSRGPFGSARGPWQYQGLCGYTSSGVGVVGVPARFNCPPEIVIHQFEPAS